ncbi:MAG: hypothetical protein FD180_4511 [Planctomycetota bacterium]|nr:MAG: hypothetical protein FD180_4511 [Planctomycetota bacterium]
MNPPAGKTIKIHQPALFERSHSFANAKLSIPKYRTGPRTGVIPPAPHPRLGPGRSISVRKIQDWMRRVYDLIEKSRRPAEVRMGGRLLLRIVPSRFSSFKALLRSPRRPTIPDDSPFWFVVANARREWIPNRPLIRKMDFVTRAGSIKKGLAAWRRSEAAGRSQKIRPERTARAAEPKRSRSRGRKS